MVRNGGWIVSYGGVVVKRQYLGAKENLCGRETRHKSRYAWQLKWFRVGPVTGSINATKVRRYLTSPGQ